MVGRRGLRSAAWLSAIALAAPLLAQSQAPGGLTSGPTGGAQFPAGGVRVEVPGHPKCVVTVEAWENGSFLVPDGQPRPPFSVTMRGRWLEPGTHDTDDQAGRDEREYAHLLALALKYSPDMVDKVTKACKIRGSIAIRLVRDDPSIPVGAAVMNSNLVLIDVGDVANTVSQVTTEHPPNTPDSTRYEAPVQAGRAFKYGLLAHEIDHLQEDGDGTHSDPGKGAGPNDQQGGAVRDENLVMDEMKLGHQRPTYIHFEDGHPVVVYQAQSTTAVFDPGKASATPRTRANGAATEGHFVPEDAATADGIEDRGCSDGAPCPSLGVRVGTVLVGDQVMTVTQRANATEPAIVAHTPTPGMINMSATNLPSLQLVGTNPLRPLSTVFDNTAVPSIASARIAEEPQVMGGSTLTVDEDTIEVIQKEELSSSHWLGRLGGVWEALARSASPARASLSRSPVRIESWRQAQPAGRPIPPASVVVVFTSLGRSSGKAFRMDVVHDGPEPIRAFGDGFVLEPLARVTPQQVQRDLARLKGRRSSATIVAYCLEFTKTPPALDTIYRLVPPEAAKKHTNLPAIMAASKRLLSSRRLNPDSDPEEYFHAIRQWALWSDERGWRTEEEFGRAFISHARKNLSSAGRPWTTQVETALGKIVRGRWRDIEAVRAEARSQR